MMTFEKNVKSISGNQDHSKRRILGRKKSKKGIEKVSRPTQSQSNTHCINGGLDMP